MRYTVAATTAIVLALAATTASAGIIISEDVVVTDKAGKQHKSEQSEMLQGNKQNRHGRPRDNHRSRRGQDICVGAGIKELAPSCVSASQEIAPILARQGMFVDYQKGAAAGKVAGYDCQNYAGIWTVGRPKSKGRNASPTRLRVRRVRRVPEKHWRTSSKALRIGIKGEIPDGMPVSTTAPASSFRSRYQGIPAAQAAKITESNARAKPEITNTKVTKIEVKDLPAGSSSRPPNIRI